MRLQIKFEVVVTAPDEPPALAYIEKTLADSYRKEIDQDENVWRSLPFFAATIALQLATLYQVVDKLPEPESPVGYISIGLLAAAGALTMTALGFLAVSIFPAELDYVGSEPELLAYALALINYEELLTDQTPVDPFSALVTLKNEVVRQYDQAADNNRRLNKRRLRLRSVAGLAPLGSVLMTVFLVAAAYTHNIPSSRPSSCSACHE